MSILINILLVIHVLTSLLIILLVLMQRPKNEGLGAAFGGGMTDNLFGAQTTNVLQTLTRWLGAIFFGLTLLLSWLYVNRTTGTSKLHKSLSEPTVAAATPAPATTPAATPDAATTPVEGGAQPQPTTPEAASEPVNPSSATPMPAETTPAPAAPATPESAAPSTPAADTPATPTSPAPADANPAGAPK